jgi:hypothetical protein
MHVFSDGDTYADDDESDFDDQDASDRYIVMSRDRSDLHHEETVVIAASDCNHVPPENVLIDSAAPDIGCDVASDDPVRRSVEFSDLDLIASTAVGRLIILLEIQAMTRKRWRIVKKRENIQGILDLLMLQF